VRRGFVDAQIFEDQVPFICLNTHYIFWKENDRNLLLHFKQ
jgi:hypothetical protein